MDAANFFESPALRLPLRRDGSADEDFREFLGRTFRAYLAEFDKLSASDPLTQAVKASKPQAEKICECVEYAVRDYLQGSPHTAFSAFESAIGNIHHHADWFPPIRILPRHYSGLKTLYRIRAESLGEGARGMEFGREGLFHIPFEKRHIVQRQRYSMPGLPCLYLGSSVYVCWEELRRLPFHLLYVSAFRLRPDQTVTVLDLSQSPLATAKTIRGGLLGPDVPDTEIRASAICWPLQAACSVRRLRTDAPFIAEYVVPQLLLEWVITGGGGTKWDGLMYSSVRCEPYLDHSYGFLNFVFPAQQPQSSGHSPILKEKFELTMPEAWQLLETAPFGDSRSGVNDPIGVPIGEKTAQYFYTPFGAVERALSALDFLPLP
jgi:hypothetical protein